jgi:hypothetical protein
MYSSCLGAADIPVGRTNKPRVDSMFDAISFTVDSSKKVQALLQNTRAALTRLFAFVFPKIDPDKTLGQLVDAFFVDTDGTIEVLKRNSRLYGALLVFQLLMGYGFEADMELLTKALPKDKDGTAVDLSAFSRPARKCARQLLELVEVYKKQTAAETAPSASTQNQVL